MMLGHLNINKEATETNTVNRRENKTEKAPEGWRKLHDELHNFYSL
jgi:hypothetical protein